MKDKLATYREEIIVVFLERMEKLELIEQFIENHSNLIIPNKANIFSDGIDIDHCTRAEVVQILSDSHVKWQRTGYRDTLIYTTIIDGVRLRLWGAEAPPSCVTIEKVVHHEAYDETIKIIECKLPEKDVSTTVDETKKEQIV